MIRAFTTNTLDSKTNHIIIKRTMQLLFLLLTKIPKEKHPKKHVCMDPQIGHYMDPM